MFDTDRECEWPWSDGDDSEEELVEDLRRLSFFVCCKGGLALTVGV